MAKLQFDFEACHRDLFNRNNAKLQIYSCNFNRKHTANQIKVISKTFIKVAADQYLTCIVSIPTRICRKKKFILLLSFSFPGIQQRANRKYWAEKLTNELREKKMGVCFIIKTSLRGRGYKHMYGDFCFDTQNVICTYV